MSSITDFHPRAEATDTKAAGIVSRGFFLKIVAGITIFYALTRLYLHEYAYTVGLDYFEPEFAAYWMPMLYAQLALVSVGMVGTFGWLWLTRDRHLEALTAEVELQRYFRLIGWLIAYTCTILITGPIAGESDAAWHQVVIRDTDFTPTHIALFYLCVPAVIMTGVGSLLYARTRLPLFSERFLLPFCVAIAGPILIMPNVGFNEWGHTFFYAEELFSAPVHWGFALLGLALLALGGIVIHAMGRMKELIDQVSANA